MKESKRLKRAVKKMNQRNHEWEQYRARCQREGKAVIRGVYR